ncbi:MAG TPA: metallophosphoesterase [Crinalium sp.]
MSLKRRQFLIWMGTASGLGLSACVHQLAVGGGSPDAIAPSPNVGLSPADASPAPATPTPANSPNLLAQNGITNPPRGEVRLAVISDLNGPYGATEYSASVHRAIALLPGWQPDIVLGGGDMVAGQNRRLNQQQVEAMWAGFDRAIAAPLRRANLPFGFTLGNHDASRAVGPNGLIYQKERELAASYWNNPAHIPALEFVDRHKFPFYYSFTKNNVFFLVWDASSSLRMPAEDLAWVEQSLSSETAKAAKLRIVIGHLPLYAVAKERDSAGEVLDGADELRSLLERHNVHTYISGHHHAYYPAHRGQLELLHAGAMGDGPRLLLAGNLPRIRTLTIVDVNLASMSTVYTTYDVDTLKLIDQNELPKLIVSHNGVVFRRDIDWSELTPAEKAICIQKHGAAVCQS